MKNLITATLISISTVASAGGLSDGQAALLGIAIGAGIRNAQPVYTEQRPVYVQPPVVIEQPQVVYPRRYQAPGVYYGQPSVTYYYDQYGRLVQQIHTPPPVQVQPSYRIVE